MDNREIFDRYISLRGQLVSMRNSDGFWNGRLSTSALSTAVAIVALKISGNEGDRLKIRTGFDWLCNNINADGGYGDTPASVSNMSTTLLGYAAIYYCREDDKGSETLRAAERWLSSQGITLEAENIAASLLKFYGNDYTFSVPIISMLVICGVIPADTLRNVPSLPFEFTLLPSSWYNMVNLRVVSYALPALIGVGIYLHKKKPAGILSSLSIRKSFISPAIKKLEKLVPDSGGFLEAIPLTGFVAMCLVAAGETNNSIVSKGFEFLRNQQREEGGWPIDTDLSTWVTTLSVKALGSHLYHVLSGTEINKLRNHLLSLQYREKHPFNDAKPGGWGWTNHPGSVPDADDTPGALAALLEIYSGTTEEKEAIENGCQWLCDLQNNDGGFPTFCRGWGRLPFDSSCADLTGHAVLALLKSTDKLHGKTPERLLRTMSKSVDKALTFLEKNQSPAGSWTPLWFGNQATDDKTNPVYGTAKVSIYLSDCLKLQNIPEEITGRISIMTSRAKEYLLTQQNLDRSWGGKKGCAGTLEETALAISALSEDNEAECLEAIEWLAGNTELSAAPIGLYFAMLWYDELMYPVIYQTEALRRFLGY